MSALPPASLEKSPGRVGTIDVLRGLAAVCVAWFHFTNGNPQFLNGGFLKGSGHLGWLGVEVFFVVSGFIIPYSLYRGGYRVRLHWRRFVTKRILRLDPPYLATIVLAIVLTYVSAAVPGFKGAQPHFTAKQLLMHLGYLNAFTGGDWLNPVFWTLAIEFQFYLMISAIFPLLVHRNTWVRIAALGSLAGLALTIHSTPMVFQWLGLFGLGIIAFQYYADIIDLRWFAVLFPAMAAASYGAIGYLPTIVGVGAGLMVAFVKLRPTRLFVFLSSISYSLYLLHTLIGGRVVNMGMRLPETLVNRIVILTMAMGISILASYLFYRFIELPSQRWSSAFRYTPAKQNAIAIVHEDVMMASPQITTTEIP